MSKKESISTKILEFIEKDRFSLTSALIYVFLIAGLRSVMEGAVGAYYGYSRYLFLQHVLLSYPQLLIGTLIIYLIIRESPKKIMNVFLLGYGFLLIPPIVDYFVFGDLGVELGTEYEYLAAQEILPFILNSWNPLYIMQVGSKGQGVMFLSLLLASASYVALKVDLPQKIIGVLKGDKRIINTLRSVFQTIVAYLGILLLMLFIGSFKLILDRKPDHFLLFSHFKVPFYSRYYTFYLDYYPVDDVFPIEGSNIMGLPENLIIAQSSLMFSSFFILLTIISTLLILYFHVPKKLSAFFALLPKRNIVLLTLSAFIGMTSVRLLDLDFSEGLAIDPTYLLHLPYLFLCIIIVVLLTCFLMMVNKLHELRDDKDTSDKTVANHFTKYHYVHLASSFALTSLFFAYILGYLPLLIAFIWIISGMTVFSHPKSSLLRDFKTPFYGLMAFFMGFYSPDSWRSKIIYLGEEVHFVTEVVNRYPPLSISIIAIILWIVLSLWFLARTDDDGASFLNQENRYTVASLIAILLSFPLIYFNALGPFLIFGIIIIFVPIWYLMLEDKKIIYFGYSLQMFLFAVSFLYIPP